MCLCSGTALDDIGLCPYVCQANSAGSVEGVNCLFYQGYQHSENLLIQAHFGGKSVYVNSFCAKEASQGLDSKIEMADFLPSIAKFDYIKYNMVVDIPHPHIPRDCERPQATISEGLFDLTYLMVRQEFKAPCSANLTL